MKRLLVFISLGLAFAAPGEVLNQILARHDVRAFRITLTSYAVLLLIGFLVEKGMSAVFRKTRVRLICYLLFSSLGLMIEWFLLGNSPVLEPLQIITQPGMFSYWGTMQLAPWLMMEPDVPRLKRPFARFFVLFSLLYLVVGLVVPKAKGGIFFAFILFAAGTTTLNWFYFRYFRDLAKGPGRVASTQSGHRDAF